jgi:pimeloyl-ACP methyl ester carboxylesterase
MFNQDLINWEVDGHYIKIGPFQHQVFYKEFGDSQADSDKTLLLLHGFPESSYSYHKIIGGMAAIFDRIVVFDMIGYGLSDKPTENYTYSLFEQADVALQVWKYLDIKGGHLLGHDMGVSVVTELVAREVNDLLPNWFSDGFQSYTFTNGSMVTSMASLRVTQKILLSSYGHLLSRLVSFKIFNHQVRSAHGNDNLSKKDIEMLWENALQQNGHRKTHLTIKYYEDRLRFEKSRWLAALSQTKIPVHFCWGEDDQVAQLPMPQYLKEKICPSASLTLMPNVGHFCQLGSPDIWVKNVGSFYKDLAI